MDNIDLISQHIDFKSVDFHETEYDFPAEERAYEISIEDNILRIKIQKAEFVITAPELDVEQLSLQCFNNKSVEHVAISNENLDYFVSLSAFREVLDNKFRYFSITLHGIRDNSTTLNLYSLDRSEKLIFVGRLETIDTLDNNSSNESTIIVGNEVSKSDYNLIANNFNCKIIMDNGILRVLSNKEERYLIAISDVYKKYDNAYRSYQNDLLLKFYRSHSLQDKNVEIFTDEDLSLVLETDIIKEIIDVNFSDNIKEINNAARNNRKIFKVGDIKVDHDTAILLCETLGLSINKEIVRFSSEAILVSKKFHRIIDDYYLSDEDFKSAGREVGILRGVEKLDALILGSRRFRNTKSSNSGRS